MHRTLTLQLARSTLHGQLELPEEPCGLLVVSRAHDVAFDRVLAAHLLNRRYAILMIDLLSHQELHFPDVLQNVPKLTERLIATLDMIRHDGDLQALPLALFSTGDLTPAAIRAAAQRDAQVKAVVCHGGLADRAGLQGLSLLAAPLLMLFDHDDEFGPVSWPRTRAHLNCVSEMRVLSAGENPLPHIAAWLSLHLA